MMWHRLRLDMLVPYTMHLHGDACERSRNTVVGTMDVQNSEFRRQDIVSNGGGYCECMHALAC